MFKNVHYNTVTSKIHLWEQYNGEDVYTVIPWAPHLYIKTDKSDIHTIDGIPVERVNFDKYKTYFNHQKNNPNVFENKCIPVIQFLGEQYSGVPDDDIEVPKLLVYYIDIEIEYEKSKGFPEPMKAESPINLISIRNSKTGRTITFGEKPYTGKSNIIYKHCPTEKKLMSEFFKYMYKHPPDVISGWNVYDFDMQYIINRCGNIFDKRKNMYKLMSPIKMVKTWVDKLGNDKIDIAGITILDYMEIYKWYTPNNLESYSLDFVSNFELQKGKLDYSEYKDLENLAKEDWNMYVDYNVIDCKHVHQIGKKSGYIKLIQALSLLTKVPMKYYSAMTQLIEGAMITYYRRNNLCAPYFAGGTQKKFPAAFVKDPKKGMHKWITSVDITSSYPSHIITLNMSIETFIGRIMDMTEEQILRHVRDHDFPHGNLSDKKLKPQVFNEMVRRKLVSVAPCGSVFTNHKKGTIATVVRNIFFKRIAVKKQMQELKSKVSKMRGDEKKMTKEKIAQLFDYQLAIKIVINAVYGILAVPYSRYFNPDIAEAVTSCGRHTIKQGEVFINDLLNDPNEELKNILEEIDG